MKDGSQGSFKGDGSPHDDTAPKSTGTADHGAHYSATKSWLGELETDVTNKKKWPKAVHVDGRK